MFHHHAQLIKGDHKLYQFLINKLGQESGLAISHPDLRTFAFLHEKLGVDEAHLIRDALLRNPAMSERTIVVAYAHTLTEQAQNALLKISEEPPVNSFFFLITDSADYLLPTLRSRFVALVLDDAGIASDTVTNASAEGRGKTGTKSSEIIYFSPEVFINAPIDKRLAMVKDIHTALDKEKMTIAEVWSFTNQLEQKLHDIYIAQQTGGANTEKSLRIAEVLTRAQKYMHAPGNSVKMLLEYIAINI